MSYRSGLAWLVLVSFVGLGAGTSDVIMAPTAKAGIPAALVFAQGALVEPSRYVPLMEQVQAKTALGGLALWVGLPATALNTPNPATLPGAVARVLETMQSQGLDDDVKPAFGGHSLGSIMVQDLVHSTYPDSPALVLTGGFLARKYTTPAFNTTTPCPPPGVSFPVPTLTVAGELDGLARVSRSGAEAFYKLQQTAPTAKLKEMFPVTVVPGINHWQSASGKPTSLVAMRDLPSEVTDDEAHSRLASIIADFLLQRLAKGQGKVVAAAVEDAASFLAPLISAYELEGAAFFDVPVQYGGPGEKACVKGGCPGSVSPWTVQAQGVVAGDAPGGLELRASNEFVQLTASPVTGGEFHLPEIKADVAAGTVDVSTFVQATFDRIEKQDTGFVMTSAHELGAKLASRQCILINATGNLDVPFSVDDPDFCRMTNERAYQWALDHAGAVTLARYQASGQKFVFGADVAKQGGPFFVGSKLQFNQVKVNGTSVVQVVSPMQKTEKDYWKNHFKFPRPSSIPDPGCYHYCKLLSPARAMEWIYVDSLRAKPQAVRQAMTPGVIDDE